MILQNDVEKVANTVDANERTNKKCLMNKGARPIIPDDNYYSLGKE